ncbi:MAG: sulfotransferase, partial [Deltaproteobacteria bacterium]|nr:sulfotransferase [Deltaproteobacteria bacterium]
LRNLRRATRQPRKKAAAAAARLARVGARGERWARQRLQGPREGARPAFLVGCGRSGTNMLVDRLSRTWELDPINEYDPAAFHEWWLRDLDTVAAVAQRSRARTVLFKPILDTPRVPQLLEHFPEGRVLFAVRDWAPVVRSALALFGPENWPGRVAGWMGDDFAEFGTPLPEGARQSVRALWRADLDPASAAALYWLFYTGLYFELGLDADPRVRPVRYEAVLEQPLAQLHGLCDFLGIGYRPRMAAGVEPRNRHASESLGVEPSIAEACDALYARFADADASSSAASNASRNEV